MCNMTPSVPYMMLKINCMFYGPLVPKGLHGWSQIVFLFYQSGQYFSYIFLEEVQCLRLALAKRPKSVGSSSIFHLSLETDAVVETSEYKLSRDL